MDFGKFTAGNLFAPQQPQQQAPAQQQAVQPTPGNMPPPNNGTMQGGGTEPNGAIPGNAQKGDKSQEPSLEQFAKLWEPNTVDPNAPKQTNFFDMDPKKLQETAGKMDFTKMVNPEHFQKIAAGGEEAGKAFQMAMKELGSGMYAQNMLTMTKVVEAALNDQSEKMNKQFGDQLKLHTVGEGLGSKNHAFNNPAVRPFVESIKKQLAEKHPSATPQELTDMAENYFTAAAGAFGTKKVDETKGAGDKSASGIFESDFAEW